MISDKSADKYSHLFDAFEKSRVIAALRDLPTDDLFRVADEIYKAGIRFIEFPFSYLNDPPIEETAKLIAKFKETHADPDLFVGAGTIISREEVDIALRYGADFLVSPNFDPDIYEYAHSKDIFFLPGAMTPSEIINAIKAGAKAVKLFPSDAFGPSYVKSILNPVKDARLIAFGGINMGNAEEYIKAGAYGLGLGSSFVKLAKSGRYDLIQDEAKKLLEIAAGR